MHWIIYGLLSCPILNSTRLRYYSRLDHLTEMLFNESFSTLSNIKKLHILLNHSAIPCTSLLAQNITKKQRNYYEAHETELHNVTNSMCYSLHNLRYRSLQIKKLEKQKNNNFGFDVLSVWMCIIKLSFDVSSIWVQLS
jgi:hypothetical protein